MHLEVRHRNVKVTEEMRTLIRERLQQTLGCFSRHFDMVRIYLWDVNGPRGGLDKRCRINIDLPPRGHVIVTGADTDIRAAIADAANRVRLAVKRQVKRRRTCRRPSRRAVRGVSLVVA